MSAPKEVCIIQLVKIQSEEKSASTSELNFTPDRVLVIGEFRNNVLQRVREW